MSTITLYRHPLSGNAHRVQLLISLLGLNAEIVDVDLMQGEQKSEAFLSKNPFGQVPVLEDGEATLYESNAILVYLASKYDPLRQWLPTEPGNAAEVQSWLSVAASRVANGPAAARLITLFGADLDAERCATISLDLFTVMETHLSSRDWLVGDHATLADVSNYAYIAHAPEGNVSLADYPNIRRWLARVEGLEGFVSMQKSAVGLAV
ncbi:glutathione S-transferase [Pseudomaricurvus alkylphenolicus]|uniref:glutathione S-transferase family protein n=1 Tax=Pseudomaricurvus alkylphenolicus TaxID=1306991 RepID=UPI00141F6BF5|nr:glutathione S-transferase [Pseudomaricurvus alkylphenolicus]NIB39296.1 glutathione S-transferase [Pseudomaricurvus alkylphenolicus]